MARGPAASMPVRASELADWALAHGRVSLTAAEAAELLETPEDQVRRRLHAPTRRGEWVRPLKSLWIPVPPEYRTWGAPPGIEIVDVMMRHLSVEYYVGWLAAAALHGASHQAPQVFQVATNRDVRNRMIGRTRFEFWTRSAASQIPTTPWSTRSGSARVSTVEATLLDVATDISAVGGLDNAATIIVELSEVEEFGLSRVLDIAELFPAASLRRAGWVLERFGDGDGVDRLATRATQITRSPSRLDPSRSLSGPLDVRWNLRLNNDVEPDL